MNEIYFSKISDGTITIREINEGDENDLYELFSNPNVCKYLSLSEIKDISKIKEIITRIKNDYYNKQLFYLGIELNNNHKIIGYIGLSRYDLTEKTCQVVYALNEEYWHKGLMVKTLKLFISYLFEVQKKDIIIATHIDVNSNSGKVMMKAGFERDEQFDQNMIIKGINQKLIGYSIRRKKE